MASSRCKCLEQVRQQATLSTRCKVAIAYVKHVCAVLATDFHHQCFMTTHQVLCVHICEAVPARPCWHALKVCSAALHCVLGGILIKTASSSRLRPHQDCVLLKTAPQMESPSRLQHVYGTCSVARACLHHFFFQCSNPCTANSKLQYSMK